MVDNNIWMSGKNGSIFKADKSGLNLKLITNAQSTAISSIVSDGKYIYFGEGTGVKYGQ